MAHFYKLNSVQCALGCGIFIQPYRAAPLNFICPYTWNMTSYKILKLNIA